MTDQAERNGETAVGFDPREFAKALHADLMDLFTRLDQFDWLLNPDHMVAVANEIDCDPNRCLEVWHEYDTNTSGCRASESGGYCPYELAAMLRDAAPIAKRLNARRNSFGVLCEHSTPPLTPLEAEMLAALEHVNEWLMEPFDEADFRDGDSLLPAFKTALVKVRDAIAKAEARAGAQDRT